MRAIKFHAIVIPANTFTSEVGSGCTLRGNERKNQVESQSFAKDVIHLLIKCATYLIQLNLVNFEWQAPKIDVHKNVSFFRTEMN